MVRLDIYYVENGERVYDIWLLLLFFRVLNNIKKDVSRRYKSFAST